MMANAMETDDERLARELQEQFNNELETEKKKNISPAIEEQLKVYIPSPFQGLYLLRIELTSRLT
jgi:hypothetical protein